MTSTSTAPAPVATARLLTGSTQRETLVEYQGTGGGSYSGNPASVVALAEAADLRGRGGAGFPLARKLTAVASQADRVRVVVANGEEGEPGSIKDRTLLRLRPHLVLDGLMLAARAVDAGQAYVYVSDPTSADAVRAALRELTTAVPVELVTVDPSYVAGEESAVVRALDGGPATPTAKPPRAFERGVAGHPTLVSNVETLAHLALVATHGATAYGRGSALLTLSGAGRPAALHEVALGSTLREVVLDHLGHDDVDGVLMGGLFGGLLGPAALDLPIDHDELRTSGTSLGCGAFHLLTREDCAVDVVADAVAYLARESSRQCGVCLNGTGAMATALASLSDASATQDQVDALGRWSTSLVGRGNCALLDAACSLVASLLSGHADLVATHRRLPCASCAGHAPYSQTRLRVEL